jgi:hypothetical protein
VTWEQQRRAGAFRMVMLWSRTTPAPAMPAELNTEAYALLERS